MQNWLVETILVKKGSVPVPINKHKQNAGLVLDIYRRPSLKLEAIRRYLSILYLLFLSFVTCNDFVCCIYHIGIWVARHMLESFLKSISSASKKGLKRKSA
jgi:hypothetical protein